MPSGKSWHAAGRQAKAKATKQIKFVHFNKMNINKREAHEERANVITRLIDGLPLCMPFVKQRRKDRGRANKRARLDWRQDCTWAPGMPSTICYHFILRQACKGGESRRGKEWWRKGDTGEGREIVKEKGAWSRSETCQQIVIVTKDSGLSSQSVKVKHVRPFLRSLRAAHVCHVTA